MSVSNHQNHTISGNFDLAIIQKLYDFAQSGGSANHVIDSLFFSGGRDMSKSYNICMIFLDLPRAPLHDIHNEMAF